MIRNSLHLKIWDTTISVWENIIHQVSSVYHNNMTSSHGTLSTLLTFLMGGGGIHWWPVDCTHKGPVIRSFDACMMHKQIAPIHLDVFLCMLTCNWGQIVRRVSSWVSYFCVPFKQNVNAGNIFNDIVLRLDKFHGFDDGREGFLYHADKCSQKVYSIQRNKQKTGLLIT